MLVAACGDDAGRSTRPARDAGPPVVDAALLPGRVADAGFYEFPCFDVGPITGEPTFTAIYEEIFCAHGCASVYCHGARGQSGGLNIETMDVAYGELIDAPEGAQPTDDGCKKSGLRRVEPGDPERSLLYRKVKGDAMCGTIMPPATGAWAPLGEAQLKQIRDWIGAGALDDREVDADAGR